MLCADAETCKPDETRRLAERVLLKQVYLISSTVNQVAGKLPAPPQTLILAGSGERLAQVALRGPHPFPLDFPVGSFISLAERLGPGFSQAACAYALAVLASERAHEWK
jgi:uncharacterized hydantoinase/oxoprolinase family protein